MNRFKNIFSGSVPYKRLKKSNAMETKCRVEEFCSAFLRSYVSVVSISTEWKQLILEDSVKRKYLIKKQFSSNLQVLNSLLTLDNLYLISEQFVYEDVKSGGQSVFILRLD